MDNLKLNSSIRTKMFEVNKEYGCFSKLGIDVDCWDEHANIIHGKGINKGAIGTKRHNLTLKFYRSLPLTPEELHYIHENLSSEAWDILGLGLPRKLEYDIPLELGAETLAWIETAIQTGKCVTNLGCNHSCDLWVKCNRYTDDHRRCGWTPGNDTISPEYIEMFKVILDAQLPSHNVIQLEREVYDNWVWWLAREDGDEYCPSTRNSSVDYADCKNQCLLIFPNIKGRDGLVGIEYDCPCNQYSPGKTRAAIEKCVALGPKFEEFPIWFTKGSLKGEKRIIASENDNYWYYKSMDELSNFVHKDNRYNSYTKTPPEEFTPYLAVVIDSQYPYMPKRGSIIKVIKGSDIDEFTCKSISPNDQCSFWYWREKDLLRITNPDELHEMSHELEEKSK